MIGIVRQHPAHRSCSVIWNFSIIFAWKSCHDRYPSHKRGLSSFHSSIVSWALRYLSLRGFAWLYCSHDKFCSKWVSDGCVSDPTHVCKSQQSHVFYGFISFIANSKTVEPTCLARIWGYHKNRIEWNIELHFSPMVIDHSFVWKIRNVEMALDMFYMLWLNKEP